MTNVHKIRPKVLFRKIENTYKDVNTSFTVNIPSSEIGGLTLLESSILVCLYKLFMPKEMFEFGTFMGASTLLLAENSADNAKVTTLDIDSSNSTLSPQQSDDHQPLDILHNADDNDAYLKQSVIKNGAMYLNRAPNSIKGKVHQIYCDSTVMDVTKLGFINKFDYIFIDGGHDYETIKIDSTNAARMATKDSVIIWHDYESKIHGDVTKFIDEYSADHTLYHVENTMLVFQLNGRCEDIYNTL